METLKVPFMQLELVLKEVIIDSYRKSKYVGIKMKEVCQLLSNQEYVKWYQDTKLLIQIKQGKKNCTKQEKKSVCDFYFNGNDFQRIYRLDDAEKEKIIDWIKFIKGIDKVDITYKGKDEYKEKVNLDLEYIIQNLLILEQQWRKKKFCFKLEFELYKEDIYFFNKVVENRRITNLVIDIMEGVCNIGTLCYNKTPSKSRLCQEIQELVNKYKIWEKYPTYNSEKLVGETVTCIVEPNVAAQLLHEAVGHLAEADVYQMAETTKLRIDQRVSTKELNIIDIPNSSELETSIFYDEEGTKAQSVQIIQEGVLKVIMSDKCSANRNKNYAICGVLRSSMDNFTPQIRMRNLIIGDGNEDLRKTITTTKYGLYIVKSDDAYRDFDKIYIHVDKAYIIENGKYIAKINDIWMYNSNIQLLSSISKIFHNGKWLNNLRCRKNGAYIWISTYSPGLELKLKG